MSTTNIVKYGTLEDLLCTGRWAFCLVKWVFFSWCENNKNDFLFTLVRGRTMAWQFGIYQMGKSIISNFHFIVKSILTSENTHICLGCTMLHSRPCNWVVALTSCCPSPTLSQPKIKRCCFEVNLFIRPNYDQ